jgi:hypothetical protein
MKRGIHYVDNSIRPSKARELNVHIYRTIEQHCKDSGLSYTAIDFYQDGFLTY